MTNQMKRLVIEMIKELLVANNMKGQLPTEDGDLEKFLHYLMTISRPAKLTEAYYKNEAFYIQSRNEKTFISIDEIEEHLVGNIYIYKGDITRIKADAIVNAANEKLIGCFVPGHHCIDNAIHLASGLQLRNACNDLMTQQGSDEDAGGVKVTLGYNLPSKYVFHTVGPNLNAMGSNKMQEVKDTLKSCYTSIIDTAQSYSDIENIVICSISTGVYGVPIEIASAVALETILSKVENRKSTLEKIVINVFSQEDYDAYKLQAKKSK